MSNTDQEAIERFGIYLNDHRAGSIGGRALARRLARSNRGSELGRFLDDVFLPQLERERRRLHVLCSEMSLSRNLGKELLAKGTELVARLKRNGQMWGYSPLSRVVEIEALVSGVTAKQRLWVTMAELGIGGSQFDGETLEGLIAGAETHIRILEAHHLEAVRAAFG